MSEEDLVENGYPRSCPTSPGKAIIKNRKEQLSRDCEFITVLVLHDAAFSV